MGKNWEKIYNEHIEPPKPTKCILDEMSRDELELLEYCFNKCANENEALGRAIRVFNKISGRQLGDTTFKRHYKRWIDDPAGYYRWFKPTK